MLTMIHDSLTIVFICKTTHNGCKLLFMNAYPSLSFCKKKLTIDFVDKYQFTSVNFDLHLFS